MYNIYYDIYNLGVAIYLTLILFTLHLITTNPINIYYWYFEFIF